MTNALQKPLVAGLGLALPAALACWLDMPGGQAGYGWAGCRAGEVTLTCRG
jgi:hypothetical protein